MIDCQKFIVIVRGVRLDCDVVLLSWTCAPVLARTFHSFQERCPFSQVPVSVFSDLQDTAGGKANLATLMFKIETAQNCCLR